MNIIADINNITALINIQWKKENVLGLIENDYGLIRYILKIIEEYTFSFNECCYVQIENKKNGQTLLHRIILEYYSQFDDKLFTILNNEHYEVNHKNKKVWDNRLENLEIVTHLGNMLHKEEKEYSSEIVMTTEELLKIREERKMTDEYRKDKVYLDRIGKENDDILLNNSSYLKFFFRPYLRFKNIFFNLTETNLTITDTTNREDLDIALFSYEKSHILYKYIEKELNNSTNIKKELTKFRRRIEKRHNNYLVNKIIEDNLNLFYRYNYKELLEVYKKYHIYNPLYNVLNDEYFGKNLLIDLFNYIKREVVKCTIYKNELLIAIPIKYVMYGYKKHDTFRVLYYLELMERKEVPKTSKNWYNTLTDFDKELFYYTKNKRHNPSFFKIPRWTKETFIKAREKAIDLLEKELYTLSHFTFQVNFDKSIADNIFKNPTCNSNTNKSIKTNKDINEMLYSFREEIERDGFILIEEIQEYLEGLNEQRKINEQPYNVIYANCVKFIRTSLQDVPETKDILKELRLSLYYFKQSNHTECCKTQTKEQYHIRITYKFKTKK